MASFEKYRYWFCSESGKKIFFFENDIFLRSKDRFISKEAILPFLEAQKRLLKSFSAGLTHNPNDDRDDQQNHDNANADLVPGDEAESGREIVPVGGGSGIVLLEEPWARLVRVWKPWYDRVEGDLDHRPEREHPVEEGPCAFRSDQVRAGALPGGLVDPRCCCQFS